MTPAEIMQKLADFNRDLDFLTAKLGIHVPLQDEVDENNVPKLVPSTDVDSIISFETKVTYFHDYFEKKFEEINLTVPSV